MPPVRPRGLVAALFLFAGLAGLVGAIAIGGRHRMFGSTLEAALPVRADPLSGLLGDLASLRGDFPPERFHEQVNGAAEFLLGLGATRIFVWDLPSPAGGALEVFAFRSEEGAARALTQDAGDERTGSVGDEGWEGSDSILFRRGRYYARLSAAGIEEAADRAALAAAATRVDERLRDLAAADGSES